MHPKTGGMGRINDIAIRYVAKLSGKGFTNFSPQLTRLIFCNYIMWQNRNCRKRRIFVAKYSE